MFARLRYATVAELGISASAALVGAVLLDKIGARGGDFFVGTLLGLGAGLGFMALAVWQRRRAL
jgi:hypothetical protein